MIDYTKCLNSYGNLSKSAFYMQKIGTIPSTFLYAFDGREVDVDKITDDLIKKIFPNHEEYWSTRTKTELKTSAVEEEVHRDDEEPELDEDIYIDGHYQDLGICVFNDNILWEIKSGSISAFFICDIEQLNEQIKDLVSKLPFKEEKPQEAEVKLIAYDGRDYYTIISKVKPTDAHIEENYNDDFLPVYDDIIKFLDQRESGLIVMRGEIGSGNFCKIFLLVLKIW